MKTTSQARSTFIDFFTKQGHTHVPSSPLIPRNDPTLLFTSAGMVQFKDRFTGIEKGSYTRAVSSQKCLRAGGKHNDLENVGFTARHHTFFEMLGNFSFGDYFKEEAISYAWECVTKEYCLPKERLLVTIYHEDEDAAVLWKKIAGLSDENIIRISTSDNFWSAGDTGPCGPCSEIFFDHGDKIAGGPPGSAEQDGDRFIEIWNLVFMQFEQQASGERVPLPKPSIDTGMGLERIATILQGVHSNFEIDLFKALIGATADIVGNDPEGPQAASYRVIADHMRACSFLIADGILPSNEGRGYVLRRIMRRAMRHAHLLGAKQPLLWRIVPTLVEQMGVAYPEVKRAEILIQQTLQLEEERFRGMLVRGLKLLHEETASIPITVPLAGDVAFKLYDTFGFPLDLTQDALKAEGRAVDVQGFEQAMEQQRQESRAKWAGSGEAKTEQIWFDLREQHGATEFLGYDVDEAEGKVLALVKEHGIKGQELVREVKAGEKIAVLTNQTPFYAESGGQMGDHGTLSTLNGCVIRIENTEKKLGALHVHVGVVEKGSLVVDDVVHLSIDRKRRDGLRQHHSATHLLHAALRKVLGQHITQKGSLVATDRLRFDFSQPTPLSKEHIKKIEQLVNREIRRNQEVNTQLMPTEQAIEMGAMALFGEKYGDEVRVVSMGSKDLDAYFSRELCGGTHVHRTGDIGFFKILSEAGVSAGVRRVEAAVGEAVEKIVDNYEATLSEACDFLKANLLDLPGKIRAVLDERKKLEGELRTLRQQLIHGRSSSPTEQKTEDVQGIKVIFHSMEGVPAADLRPIVDKLKHDIKSGMVVLASKSDDKVALVVGVTADLTERVNAVPLVKAGSLALGGTGGGGRADFAQGGGPSPEQIEASFEAIRQHLATSLR